MKLSAISTREGADEQSVGAENRPPGIDPAPDEGSVREARRYVSRKPEDRRTPRTAFMLYPGIAQLRALKALARGRKITVQELVRSTLDRELERVANAQAKE